MLKRLKFKFAPKTSKEAKVVGAKFYFTGKPCKRGHIALRYAHGSCIVCKEEDRQRTKKKSAKYCRKWRKLNPHKQEEYHEKQKRDGYSKRYYKKNRKRLIEKTIRWRKRNLKKSKAYAKKYYEDHIEEIRRKAREYTAKCSKQYKKERLERARRDRANNPIKRERHCAKSRAYRRKYPDRVRISGINKKAKRKLAPGKFTRKDIESKFKKQKYLCVYCPKSIKQSYHIDHIISLSRGGTNRSNNIQLLCPTCNMEKHNADPIEFAKYKRQKAA